MPQQLPPDITEFVNAIIHAYPTGLPDGVRININFNITVGQETRLEPAEISIEAPESRESHEAHEALPNPENIQAYKGPFLGLYRVNAKNGSGRIKIRSDFDLTAPEASVKLSEPQYKFLQALNPREFAKMEQNGYIYMSNGANPQLWYRQYGFNGQLLMIAETRVFGNVMLGRVVGIGENPYLSDPKPLNPNYTNHQLTPWLVHNIEQEQLYAPILTAGDTPGWVNMQEVEKVR
jgi:hypothetical protein